MNFFLIDHFEKKNRDSLYLLGQFFFHEDESISKCKIDDFFSKSRACSRYTTKDNEFQNGLLVLHL